MKFPYTPSDDSIVVTSENGGDPFDVDGMQIFQPAHHGTTRSEDFGDVGEVALLSGFCGGCGERQIQLTMKGKNGKVSWVKLRPSMAIKIAEIMMLHAKAGMVTQ